MIKNQTGNKVKTLRTDDGTQFMNQEMKKLLSRLGIIHERTIPYTLQGNEPVERDNCSNCKNNATGKFSSTKLMGRNGKHSSLPT
jgi:transposase InsO family protein